MGEITTLSIRSENHVVREHPLKLRADGTFTKATSKLIMDALNDSSEITMALTDLDGLTKADIRGIAERIRRGKKIDAIKMYRAATGTGLVPAKNVITEYLPFQSYISFTGEDLMRASQRFLKDMGVS